jgi:hypothetical protein
MHSNRTVQTLIMAAILALLAAMVFRKAPTTTKEQPAGAASAIEGPSVATIQRVYKAMFQEHPDASRKAELISVAVRAISTSGSTARARLRIEIKWMDDNPAYTLGPLRNAPGQKGDRVSYTETFDFRYWNTGWDIEGRIEATEIR